MPTPPWEQTQCTGKHPFADKGLALNVAKRQRRNRDGAHSAVYRCAFCGAKLRAVGGRLELDQAPIVTSAEDARMRAAIVEVCRG